MAEPLTWMLDSLVAAEAPADEIADRFAPGFLEAVPGAEARRLVDQAYGAGGVLAGVRRHWDLAWYEGGSIPTADGAGLEVLTHGWMVEGQPGAYAVVVLGNGGPIDELDVASVAQRLHRILFDDRS